MIEFEISETKASENETIGWESYSYYFSGCIWSNLHRLPLEGRTITGAYYAALLDRFIAQVKKHELGFERRS